MNANLVVEQEQLVVAGADLSNDNSENESSEGNLVIVSTYSVSGPDNNDPVPSTSKPESNQKESSPPLPANRHLNQPVEQVPISPSSSADSGTEMEGFAVTNGRKRNLSNSVATSDEDEGVFETNGHNNPKRRCPDKNTYSSVCSRGVTETTVVNHDLQPRNLKLEDLQDFPELGTSASSSTSGLAGDATALNDDSEHYDRWNDHFYGRTLQEKYYNLWTTTELKDITFKFGDNECPGHRLIFSALCKNPTFISKLNRAWKTGSNVEIDEMPSPTFWEIIQVIYNGTSSDFTSRELLRAAQYLQFKELVEKCVENMKKNIDADNVFDLFFHALSSNDEQLKNQATRFITSNIKDVLQHPSFGQLSIEKLCTFLQNDDWYAEDEFVVFDNVVRRWAASRLETANAEQRAPTAQELRDVLGPALFQIRFASLENDSFNAKVFIPYKGLIAADEAAQITGTLTEDSVSQFNMRTRSKPAPEVVKPASLKKATKPVTSIKKRMKPKIPCVKRTASEGVATVKQSTPKSSKPTATPAKNSSKLPEKPQDVADNDPTIQMALTDYVKLLKTKTEEELGRIEEVKTKVRIPSVPRDRILLPNLKTFHLDVAHPKPLGKVSGSKLKQYFGGKLMYISDLLFYDKPTIQPVPAEEESVLRRVMLSRVNVKIVCGTIVFLNINHDESSLTLSNFTGSHAQAIVDAARGIPFRVFSASDCDFAEALFLDSLDKPALEILTLHTVKGLCDHNKILENFPNLKEYSSASLGLQSLDLFNFLKNSNPNLRKLALANVKISGIPDGELLTVNSSANLEELFIDKVTCDKKTFSHFKDFFPRLKRCSLYGYVTHDMVDTILQVKSLESLSVCEMKFVKKKMKKVNKKAKKKPIVGGINDPWPEEAKRVRECLSEVFDMEFANQGMVSFILNKKRSTSPESAQDTFRKSSSDLWIGEKLKFGKNTHLYREWSKMDFQTFGWKVFFGDFYTFEICDTSEDQFKKNEEKKNKQEAAQNQFQKPEEQVAANSRKFSNDNES